MWRKIDVEIENFNSCEWWLKWIFNEFVSEFLYDFLLVVSIVMVNF